MLAHHEVAEVVDAVEPVDLVQFLAGLAVGAEEAVGVAVVGVGGDHSFSGLAEGEVGGQLGAVGVVAAVLAEQFAVVGAAGHVGGVAPFGAGFEAALAVGAVVAELLASVWVFVLVGVDVGHGDASVTGFSDLATVRLT